MCRASRINTSAARPVDAYGGITAIAKVPQNAAAQAAPRFE
ncbi:hypothetical protein [Paraburkholderia caffeinilytica]|nr:hypothetical protein [Paraburkholderia caffeinilytica]